MQNMFTDRTSQETVSGPDMTTSGMASSAASRLARWVDKKLQRKLVFILVILLLVTSISFLVMVIALYKGQLVSEHARASMQVNRLLQVSLENAMLKRDIDGLRDIVSKLGKQDGIVGVAILNPDFEIRFTSGAKQFEKTLASPLAKQALNSKLQQTDFISLDDGTLLLRSINPVHNRPQCKECHGAVEQHPVNGLLVVDYQAAGIKQGALNSALTLGAIGAFVVLATGAGIWLAVNWLVVARLSQLGQVNRQFASGNMETRAEIKGQDEIAELASSFNHMAERLGNSLQALNASEKFLQNVIDSIPDGVRLIDDEFNIVKANQAYCQQVGQSMEKVIAAKCYQSSHNRNEPCPVTLVDCPVVNLRASVANNLKSRHQHFNADGRELFVEVSAARVKLTLNDETSFYVIESIRDLAEQAKVSQEQRLSEIGQLATGVAHEIHNPLTSILFALESMQGDVSETDKVRKSSIDYLEVVEAEIKKCLEVTDRLLLLSHLPGDGETLIDVKEAVNKTISLLSYHAEHANVHIELNLEDDLRLIAGNSDIGMIVINLAQNAIHAMPQGGQLTINGKRKGKQIKLVFSDTGGGIEKKNLERIFLPFWTKRADASNGHGLGLYISKSIVDRIGGTISVKSTVGGGTVFSILFPDADFGKAR